MNDMMAGAMKRFASFLGVSLGERFIAESTDKRIPTTCVITESGLMMFFNGRWQMNNDALYLLCTGLAKIVKEQKQ